ncbi:SEP-domain-containing protein [Trichoderma citrinoviride]|uniref:SEP-domain-containing protein n=1 Tax=Trichoderma citrinoviride TaxID=58853 RepID=A0A2T4BJ78_9HYPO|nr:SEP-domain-containing protein [Trichoderma citrinoviride]PTB69360.1 SEP-domain-containing protein [Trichoderma citrinoviride]
MVREDEPKDHDEMVRDFVTMSGASVELATQYLETNGWDMLAACNSYFHDEDERNDARRRQQAAEGTLEQYSGPRTLDGRPAPQEDFSSLASRQAKQPKKKGIATLGSLASSSSAPHNPMDDEDDEDEDDEDDDGRGNLFAGGEKSGLAVQDPRQEGGSRKIISDILAKAKANSRQSDPSAEAGPSRPTHFRGTGVTLGGDGVESRSIPDPRGAERPSGPPVERVLHIWQDGFSIDDGELRRFDDPSNEADLQLIRSGRAPLHLMNVQHDQSVDVKLHQHDTPYKQPPKKYKPFSGTGNRLGSPVPGASSTTSSTPAPATPPAAASAPTIDDSQPTLMIRIQMPDGSRLPARFNTTHTIGDVYGFVQGASVETRTRPWVLFTTFPNKEHTDKSLVLGEMPEFKKGGTAVVKWV